MQVLGKIIIFVGLILILLGVIIFVLGNKISFFGNLPGDIRIEKNNYKIYFPITSLLLFSIFINFLIYLIKKIFF